MKSPFFAILVLFSALPAHALVGGAVDDNLAGSPWAGVGAVSVNGSVFSGALIGSRHVLTAAHVVGGQAGTPGNVSFTLNVGGNLTHTFSVASIKVFPGYTGTAPGADGVWHDDLALITLSAPVMGTVPVYGLYGGNLNSQTITLVGYGAGGDGIDGVTSGAMPSVKRVGQNRADRVLADDDGSGQAEVFLFDFDGANSSSNVFGASTPSNLTLGAGIEAQFAGGDSGSPVFVNDNGVWKIAGIAAFNGSTPVSSGSSVKFGAIGGGAIVAAYLPWVQSTLAAPVPEPDAWLMLLVGLGLVGAAKIGLQKPIDSIQ
ncbi:MAG: trypsin-like serine protease [Thiobacillus sp.]|nr:trypsin-like serine protease [Thiobacillus sp.]